MSELFGRRCTVQMGTVLVEGLRVQFKVEKTDQVVPSHAEVTVWNLSRKTRDQMVSATVPLILSAGYGDDVEQLFNGDVLPLGISVVRNGPDWLTTFKVGDGIASYQTERVQVALPPNLDVKQALAQLLGQLKKVDAKKAISDLTSGKTTVSGAFQQLLNGSVASGRTLDEVHRLAKSVGLKAKVVDGQVELTPATETSPSGSFPDDLIPDLTPQTGLIGSPEPTKDRFIKLRCLLRPKIKPDRLVRVSWSVHPEGINVRARRVTHAGDTRGQEWYTDVEGTAL